METGKRRCAMAGGIYVVIGVMGLMFMAFSLLGLDSKYKG
jgi:hypothetical protein